MTAHDVDEPEPVDRYDVASSPNQQEVTRMEIVDLSDFYHGRSGRKAHLGDATSEAIRSHRRLLAELRTVFDAKAAELRRREEDRRNEWQRQRDLRSEFGRTLERAFANAKAAGQITVSALVDDATSPAAADGDTSPAVDDDTAPGADGPVTVEADRPITNADLARALESWNANRNRGGAK